MKLIKTLSLSLLFSLVLFTVASYAQSETLAANINVLTPLTTSGSGDLNFADAFPGDVVSVGVADPEAVQFDVTGEADEQIDVTFTLPASLSDGGTETIDITFDAAYDTGTDASVATPHDPTTVLSASLDATGALYIWLGGDMTLDAAQAPGSYSGTIDVDFAYTNL